MPPVGRLTLLSIHSQGTRTIQTPAPDGLLVPTTSLVPSGRTSLSAKGSPPLLFAGPLLSEGSANIPVEADQKYGVKSPSDVVLLPTTSPSALMSFAELITPPSVSS